MKLIRDTISHSLKQKLTQLRSQEQQQQQTFQMYVKICTNLDRYIWQLSTYYYVALDSYSCQYDMLKIRLYFENFSTYFNSVFNQKKV